MDAAFRDTAAAKHPLWEEISRKLAELGYNRNAKKCKEKFENVYKYHKRIKEGRRGKSESKHYRFFEQLQLLENQTVAMAALRPAAMADPPVKNIAATYPEDISSFPNNFPEFQPDSFSSSSDDLDTGMRRKRKRKYWEGFFERLTKKVVEKQDELQRRFIEATEKGEVVRLAREEAWRKQETARINHEQEITAQERSVAGAKDAAVMAMLQKLSKNPKNPTIDDHHHQLVNAPPALVVPPLVARSNNNGDHNFHEKAKSYNDDGNFGAGASSRWPKSDIEALICLKTNLDSRYQENGPKGPLWEEISAGMRNLGFNRSSKRCKEKWENINKYFKKVKESNKTRPQDSKTCSYFPQLEAIYRNKNKSSVSNHNYSIPGGWSSSTSSFGQIMKLENTLSSMMDRPEQQWQALIQPEKDDDDNGDVGGGGGEFEIVPNNNKPILLGTDE